MKSATFRDFEGKPLGILCQDGLVITGLAQSLDPDNGNLTLRQATTFLYGSVIRKQVVVVNRDSVVDACVLPASEELGTMPDMRNFPSLKNAPDSNDARYMPDRTKTANLPPRRSESEYSRSSVHPQSNINYEISEDDFEKIRIRSIDYGSDVTCRDSNIARGEKYQHPQPLFEHLPSSILRQYDTSHDQAANSRECFSGASKRQTAQFSQNARNRVASPSDYSESKPANSRRNKTRNNYLTPGDSDLNDSDYQLINPNSRSRTNSNLDHPVQIRTKHKLKKEPVDWCLDNIIGPSRAQFDFQGNLDLFNKAEEFAKIKEQDTIPYEDRLVGHNRRPSRYDTGRQSPFPPPPRNLKNTENVLEPEPSDKTVKQGLEPISSHYKRPSLSSNKHILKTDDGLVCPMVSKDILLQVERLAMSETGPNEDQILENAGRSIALMALKALGGARRLRPDNHNPSPTVIILSGNNKTGAYGICASRHLANRGCDVSLLTVGNPRNLLKIIYEQQRYAACSGVNIIHEARDLPNSITCPVDLIIDSLLGYEHTLATLPDSNERIKTADLIDWANSNNAPVISIGLPSGFMEDSALSGFSPTSDHVRPKWTLSLGAPTTALSNRTHLGEIYLGDIGIPTSLWQRVGINWRCPYGASYLVRLAYV